MEPREFQFSNFARSTLASGLAIGATSLFVQESDASKFPNADATYDEIFACILFAQDESIFEIVYVTANINNEFTVERAKENTTEREWPAGTQIVHNLTAQLFTDIVDAGPRVDSLLVAISSTTGSLNQNRVMTSPNGSAWTLRDAGVDQPLRGIAFSPTLGSRGRIVVVGEAGTVITSDDGLVWTVRTSGNSQNWDAVAWSPSLNLFAAIANSGTDRIMTSPDGITWTLRTTPAGAAVATWNDIIWSTFHSLFIAANNTNVNGEIMTSTDGITWTLNTSPAANIFRLAVRESDGRIISSNRSDVTFQHTITPAGAWTVQGGTSWPGGATDVAYSPTLDRWAASFLLPQSEYTDDHTAAWLNVAVPSSAGGWEHIIWSTRLGLFVMCADTGGLVGNRIATSPNVASGWTLRTTPAGGDVHDWERVIDAEFT